MSTEITTVDQLLAQWDAGGIVRSISLGGLGPGYEQAIQVAAIEMARAGRDFELIPDEPSEKTNRRWSDICHKAIEPMNKLYGLSGAQFGQASWLAYQWCNGGGPADLIARARQRGEPDRVIQISNHWPRAEDIREAS